VRLAGYEAQFIALSDRIHRAMPEHMVTVVAEALNERGRAVRRLHPRARRDVQAGCQRHPGVHRARDPRDAVPEGRAYADSFVPQLILDSLKLTAGEPSPGPLVAADCVLILTNDSRFDYAAIAAHALLVVDTQNAMKVDCGPGRSIFTL
jgi:UDP-N-acetyl-D-glucosamine dehydrogenase